MTNYLAVVKDGKITLNVPNYSDGTKLELKLISVEKTLQDQLTTKFKQNGKQYGQEMLYKSQDINNEKSFEALGLIDPILDAVAEQHYKQPTPIQEQTIPDALNKRDILGTAQTGSGKTAAFALPMIQLLMANRSKGKPKARGLILAPTRELVSQITDSIHNYSKYSKIKYVSIYGGVSQRPQVKQLQSGKDIIVATPGRLLDLINQGFIILENIEIFVLDEADRMLDMGFIRDIRKIMKYLPLEVQVLLFSATMPNEILTLADDILRDPVNVAVDPPSTTVETIDNYVYFVEKYDKFRLLLHLLKEKEIEKALIFTRTKHGSNNLAKKLKRNKVNAVAIHGDKSQNAREKALSSFREGNIDILVATDIAARGIDVDDITHVINFDLPNEPETFVHRIGRTARAGKSGIAFNFCSEDEIGYLEHIEYLTQEHLLRVDDYPFMCEFPIPDLTDLERRPRKVSRPQKRRGGRKNYSRKRLYRGE